MTRKIHTDEFVRRVAHRARFTQGDVRIILEAMIDVITEAIESKTVVHITGFGKIVYGKIKARKASSKIDPTGKKILPEAIKLNWRLSPKLRELVK